MMGSAYAKGNLPACPSSGFLNNCFGTYTFKDGRKYVGEFKGGEFWGQGTFTFPSGIKYVGEFELSRYHGQGIRYLADGSISQSGVWSYGSLVTAQMVDPENFLRIEAAKEGEEKRNQLGEQDEMSRKKAEEQQSREQAIKEANEYPYYAVFKCTTNDFPVNFISCLYGGGVNTEIELKNGSDYKLYQGADFSNKFEDYEGGKLVKLKTSFDITAQNASNNLILGLTIYDRATNKIVFQKQVSRFGVIKVHN